VGEWVGALFDWPQREEIDLFLFELRINTKPKHTTTKNYKTSRQYKQATDVD